MWESFIKRKIFKAIVHSGSTGEGMLNYIILILEKDPDILIICTGTNNLINGVNKVKEVRELVLHIWVIDDKEEINTDFSRIISRSDTNLEKEIKKTHIKLRK